MNNYDLGKLLSPLRFEQITRDLLSKEYGVFENFSEGKDGGIDFRYSQSKDNILIVQCKRYNNLSNLISNLRNEAKKASNLKFSKYLLVVSLDLTDKNKIKIIEVFQNIIQNSNQIITNSDLNYLLGLTSNQDVEFKYPELWMKSINIHQKIYNLGFLKHSEFIKDKLNDSLKKFVPYKEYYRVIDHFKYNDIAIVSGNPGVGKTTLSYAVISHYIYFKDYQIIDISYRKIQEAESFIYDQKPTIFLIDDFLGKIKLDKDDNFSELLLHFIKKIEKQQDKKLIITSREYIIRKAKKELFSIDEINQSILKYTIEIKSFTRRIRTEILYNHIKNSQLKTSFINNFLNNNFKLIIDHDNYNPRIIEHLTNTKLLRNITSDNYFDYFVENLKNPLKIWQKVYDNLPNDLYKIILFTKFLMSEQTPVEKLEKAITFIIDNNDKFKQYSYDDFEYIIKEMEGTFFLFQDGYDELIDEEYTIIVFQNPSIIDFIDSFIWKKNNWLKLIINNAIYFEQLFNWELLQVIKKDHSLKNTFSDKIINDFNNLKNAGIGYFEYDSGEEGTFICWIPERYNYYLSQCLEIINIKNDSKAQSFLKKEIFRYSFEWSHDISEKISFTHVANILLEMKIIDSEQAINHYLSGECYDIKELVFLEYMTRGCDKASLSLIKKNKSYTEEADNLFLDEISNLNEKDFIGLMDFMDDFTQIKNILPLKKASLKLKKINSESLYSKSYKKLGNDIETNEKKKQVKPINEEYNDITDNDIDDILNNLLK